MFKKKDIDVKNLVTRSYNEALKQNGFVNEELITESNGVRSLNDIKSSFNVEEHISKIKMKPKFWAIKGSVDANYFDALVKGIKVTGSDPVDSIRKSLEKFNKVLGIKVSDVVSVPVSAPEFDEGDASTPQEILSAIHFKSVLHDVIVNQPSSNAGKILESVFARILGGSSTDDKTNPIEDIIVGEDLLSLKVLEDTTKAEFKGSKINLAKGIQRSPRNEITYIIMLKSSADNPFILQTRSFKINQDNYFSFITGKLNEQLTPKIIIEEVKSLVKEDVFNSWFTAKGEMEELHRVLGDEMINPPTSTRVKPEFRREIGDISDTALSIAWDNLLKKYPQYAGVSKTKSGVIQFIKDLLSKELDKLKTPTNNLDDVQSSMEFLKKNEINFDTLEKIVFSSGEKTLNLAKVNAFSSALNKISKLLENEYERASIYEKDPELLKYIEILKSLPTDSDENDITAVPQDIMDKIDLKKPEYNEKTKLFYDKIQSIITFITNIFSELYSAQAKTNPKASPATIAPSAEGEKSLVEKVKRNFFQLVPSLDPSKINVGEKDKEKNKEKKKEEDAKTQFNIKIPTALTIAARSQVSDYKDDYPKLIIEKGWLFKSSKKNEETLRQKLIPFYQSMYIIDAGVEQFFVYNNKKEGIDIVDAGISQAQDASKSAKQDLNQENPSPQQQPVAESIKLKENKTNKPLTKHWSDDILEEILND